MPAAVKQYEEIVLRIEPSGEDGYVVRATAPEGEAHAPFELPLSKDRIDFLVLKAAFPRRGRRRIESSALREVTELGDSLFKALFRDEVRDLYRTARASADARDHGLRVKLALTDVPELMTLPWEFLYDDPSFLSISQLTPIVRYLDLPRTRPVREVEPPLRILALVSSPVDAAELDTERERANLEEGLGELSVPTAIAGNPSDGSACTAEPSGAVTHVDASGHVIGTPAKVSPAPTGVGCGEGWVWVVNGAPRGLVRVAPDGTTMTFDTRAEPVAVTFDQGVWTAHADGHITRFDPRFDHLNVSADLPVASELDAIAAREQDTSVWATSRQTMSLYRISNTSQPEVTGKVVFTSPPVGVAVAGDAVWVGTQDGSLTQIRF